MRSVLGFGSFLGDPVSARWQANASADFTSCFEA